MNLSTSSATSPQKKPYRFDLSFDDGLNDDTPQILTNGEIKTIKTTSHQEGHELGKKEIQESLTSSIKIILETLHFDVDNLLQNNKLYHEAVAADSMTLLKSIMGKIAPYCINSTLFEEIDSEIKQCLRQHQDSIHLTLELQPDILKIYEQYVQEFSPDLAKKIRFIANENLGEGDYTLNWGVGFLQKNRSSILQKIEEKIELLSQELSEKNPYFLAQKIEVSPDIEPLVEDQKNHQEEVEEPEKTQKLEAKQEQEQEEQQNHEQEE